MNYFSVFIISAFSIAIPGIAAIFRIKRLNRRFIPLALLFWAGLLNETISYFLIIRQHNNSVNSNIYTLLEFLILLWIFYRMAELRSKFLLVLSLAGGLIWIIDIFIFHSFFVHNTFSRMIFSLVIVYLSIDKINQSIFNAPVDQRTGLLLWFSFFVYFAYQAFITIFELFPMGISNEFYLRLYLILSIINFLTNLVYTAVILWIPKHVEYI